MQKENLADSFDKKPDSLRLNTLLQEYLARNEQKQDSYRLIIQVAGIAVALFVGVAAYVLPNIGTIHEAVCWLLPTAFVIPYAIVLQLLFGLIFMSYYLRDLEDAISNITKLSLFNFQLAETRGLWSPRTGNRGFWVVQSLIIAAATTIYFCLVWIGYSGLHNETPAVPMARIIGFLVFQGLLTAAMFSALIQVNTSTIHKQYRRWIQTSPDTTIETPRFSVLHLLYYALLPRLSDLIFKGTIFLFVLLLTAFALNVKFSTELIWSTVIVFLCFEFLAKQATYIWNDIRDIETDSLHPHKKGRFLAKSKDINLGKFLFIFRACLAFGLSITLAVLQGLWWLPLLIGLTYMAQFLYDWWAKSDAVRRLCLTALRYGERAAVPALLIMWYQGTYDFFLLVLVILWTIAFAFVFLSEYWWAENDYKLRKKDQVNGQIWFLNNGIRVSTVANILLFPIGAIIATDYFGLPFPKSASILITGSIVGIVIALLFRKVVNSKTRAPWLFGILLASGLTLAFVPDNSFRWLALILIAPIFISALYAKLSYEEINLMFLLPNVKRVLATTDRLLFGAVKRPDNS